jgi:hypothetical protein
MRAYFTPLVGKRIAKEKVGRWPFVLDKSRCRKYSEVIVYRKKTSVVEVGSRYRDRYVGG